MIAEDQISAGVFAYITEIRNRRLLVIDEQKGLAVGFSNFHQQAKSADWLGDEGFKPARTRWGKAA